ncbi:hypothetical protein PoB_002446500 [Plakobranchus ocellatus]|uniref:Uncharacterized protein n=1 Tax=Plakobranchus ocellatus TaxID=259542 RepID=A0AAV3ZTK7_9GAST|nr:hypothetical protein PoB_002446500 [Plakobranchus ocellatus]
MAVVKPMRVATALTIVMAVAKRMTMIVATTKAIAMAVVKPMRVATALTIAMAVAKRMTMIVATAKAIAMAVAKPMTMIVARARTIPMAVAKPITLATARAIAMAVAKPMTMIVATAKAIEIAPVQQVCPINQARAVKLRRQERAGPATTRRLQTSRPPAGRGVAGRLGFYLERERFCVQGEKLAREPPALRIQTKSELLPRVITLERSFRKKDKKAEAVVRDGSVKLSGQRSSRALRNVSSVICKFFGYHFGAQTHQVCKDRFSPRTARSEVADFTV